MDNNIAISIRNMYFSYAEEDGYILEDINTDIYDEETLVIVGSSGCGKSTFLKISAALLPADSGDVIIHGINVTKAPKKKLMELHKQTGFIFQDAALISNMRVYDNLALPLRYHTNMSEKEIEYKVQEILERVDMKRDVQHLPAELSLGEQKLVSIARAIIFNPKILYYDEPLASLDAISVQKVIKFIKELKTQKITSIIISHDIPFISSIADRICVLHNGRIIACGPVQEILKSQDTFIREIFSQQISKYGV